MARGATLRASALRLALYPALSAPCAALCVALTLGATSVLAQVKLEAPPPLPAATKANDPQPAAPPPAADAPAAPSASPGGSPSAANPLTAAPTPRIDGPDADVANPLPPAKKTSPETKIEQRRQGNRVVEIVVTPAGSTRSYVIENREGKQPLSPQSDLSGGLSTPRFLQFEF
jgi:hypothetical protein